MSQIKAGWARVVAVGPEAALPRAPARELDETRTLPRELLLARARRLAWRAPPTGTAPLDTQPSDGQASARTSGTAASPGTSRPAAAPRARARARPLPVGSRPAAEVRRWLALARGRRHARAAGALVGLSLLLVFVSLGGSAPGAAGAHAADDADRIQTRALVATASAASTEPSAQRSPPRDPSATTGSPADVALERRAADAVAEGRHADAARLHARLAELHPERAVFRAAARILDASARELAAAEPGNVVWAGRGSDVR